MSILDEHKPQFEKVLERLHEETAVLRTGRASPALVENVMVEAYGITQPIKALAAMSTPDARTLAIDAWDTSVIKAIETAIQASNIGINPVVDGKTIRLNMPMMTEESRMKLVKVLGEKMEDARVAIRKHREDAKKKIEKQSGMSEDVIRKELESLEKTVKEYVAKIEAMGEKKEKEIMSI